jgi:hypothetical protein
MNRAIFGFGLLCLGFAAAAADQMPQRTMGLTQGPDTVFERPPAEFIPALVGAELTGENGRVGTELAFWGYRQRDGQRVFLFACAQGADFDCRERAQLVCPDRTSVLSTQELVGNVVRRNCRSVAIDAPNTARPGCNERLEDMAPLLAGLVSCG